MLKLFISRYGSSMGPTRLIPENYIEIVCARLVRVCAWKLTKLFEIKRGGGGNDSPPTRQIWVLQERNRLCSIVHK